MRGVFMTDDKALEEDMRRDEVLKRMLNTKPQKAPGLIDNIRH